ncbi:MAG: MFS transporter [Candidatus Heimdallarchaeota archaeon]|nr:MFS transporter [Candidatus Heimdallarchaeota archaeon]
MTDWKRLFPILFINFVSALSFSIVLPFLIILVVRFGGNAVVYGILGASFSFFQLIGSPILGNWSDRVGRRKVLLISHGGTVLSWFGILLALSITASEVTYSDSLVGTIVISVPLILLFVSRIADGLTGGNISVANAYLVDISTDEDRAANFGYMGVSANVGFIVGPLIAAFASETSLGLKLPIILAIIIGFVGLVIISRTLERTVADQASDADGEKKDEQAKAKENEKITFAQTLQIPHIRMLLTINFLIFLAFNFFFVSFPPFLLQELGWSLTQLGILFSFFGLSMAITQGPILGFVSKRFERPILVTIGSMLMIVGFYILSIGETKLVFVSIVFIAMGNGISYPSLLAIIASHGTSGHIQGRVQGLTASVGSAAAIIGLLLGGILFASIQGSVFLISASIFIAVMILSLRMQINEEEHEATKVHLDLTHRFLGSHSLWHLTHREHSAEHD